MSGRTSKNICHSGFMITINTNKRYQGFEETFENDVMNFAKTINELFDNVSGIKLVTKCKDKNVSIDQLFADNSLIRDIDISKSIEIGPQTNTLHCHVVAIYHHYSKLQISVDDIKKYFADKGYGSVHCFYRFFTDSAANMQSYIGKTVNQIKESLKQKNDKLIATTQ